MTTTPDQLLELTVAALAGRTDALDRVYSPRTWATRTDIMPVVLVRLVTSNKTSLGRGDTQFQVVDTVEVIQQTASLAAGDDAGLLAAEADAWRIQRQIEAAIIDNDALMSRLQQIPFFNAVIGQTSDGQMAIVQIASRLGLEYYQGPEDFGLDYEGGEVATTPLDELREVRITADVHAGLDPVAVALPVQP